MLATINVDPEELDFAFTSFYFCTTVLITL